MKYTFTQEYEDKFGNVNKVVHEFYAETHYDIAEQFNYFLRGCGYIFSEGESYDLVDTKEFEFPTQRPDDHCGICGMSRESMDGYDCYDKCCDLGLYKG